MGTLRRSRGRRTRPAADLALFFLLLLLPSGSAWPLAQESSSVMRLGRGSSSRAAARRWLVGPGSTPPSCRSRCGNCLPCKPVHVPVQPGLSTPLEYYPEAWRCKCGNKLFMP